MTADPFGTAALRRAVVDAWRTSPTRLREDANLEEDHARGYYRDRVVVELAQNAADAAARAGVPGRVAFRLDAAADQATLRVTNIGAPLDADGVASLASLRASAKGAGQVGRFGVGFAAVRSVSDDVSIRSTTGGVRFAESLTRAELARGGYDVEPASTSAQVQGPPRNVAVLRLPFPVEAAAGEETVVELVLRDREAVAAVRAQLDAVDDALLLALPALEQVTIEIADPAGTESRVHRDVADRWITRRAEGELTSDDVADLPTEQRRTPWSLTWALPRTPSGQALGVQSWTFSDEPEPLDLHPRRAVLHAPTPTDVPLTFPALLIATLPVDPGRRRVLPGAATDRLAAEAGRAYAALLAEVAADRGAAVLALVPGDLPAGELDAAIREAAIDALRAAPLLPAPAPAPAGSSDAGELQGPGNAVEPASPGRASHGRDERVAPQDAVLLAGPVGEDADVAAVLGTVPLAVRWHTTARRLGARVAPLADVLDELPTTLPPARWRAVYAALAPHAADPAVREALAGAPVPLADGRVARGARGLVLPLASGTATAAAETAAPTLGSAPQRHGAGSAGTTLWSAETLGVRIVHPDAAHPVLERVGAVPFDPRAILGDPEVRAAALAAAGEVLDGGGDVGGRGGGPDGYGDAATDVGPQDVVDAVLYLAGAALSLAGAGDHRDAEHERDAGDHRSRTRGLLPFWVGEMPVRTSDGELAALRETAVPGSWAEDHLDALSVVDADDVETFGAAVLRAAGAHSELDVYTVRDAVTPAPDGPAQSDRADEDDPAGWLAGWSDYLDHLADRWGADVLLEELEAVADLDAVADDAWPAALARLAADPAARRALLGAPRPGAGARPGAGHAPSYTAWWLRRNLGAPFRLHDDVPLLPPAPPATHGLDEEVLRALGGVGSLDDSDPADWPAVLGALPPVGTVLPLRDALAVWRGLAALADHLDPAARTTALTPLPDRLPAVHADAVVVADAGDVLVAPALRWAQLGPVLPAPADAAEALAELLDINVAEDEAADAAGDPQPIDPRVVALDPHLPARWHRHDHLTVAGLPVSFWVHDGEVHATDEAALARALADLLGAPHLAAMLAEALAAPESAATGWTAVAWSL
ncbi:sacsin N-terminal ATP-binding-like domain-containing protein [Xylanimonas sp. McL0601]|uniref:sacsin N-terminal ATP-binding-like domain-containing protein n=1 Tax=Xylanimonas sp. McL0601 TaxID=3414739 RepID=UPI003CEC5BCA